MIKKIYDRLLSAFGEQGWWPTSRNGIPEHHGEVPKTDDERFEIIIGAILTQNTNWKNVEKAIVNLNKEKLIGVEQIKNVDIKRLAELIRPSGYYNQKAERLKTAAEFFEGNFERFLKSDARVLREELLLIKGIGPETADSILLYAFGKRIFVIDAYTKRIMKRVGLDFGDYDDLQSRFVDGLDKDEKIYNEYHALLVELGKNHCKSRDPDCSGCPLDDVCEKQ